MSKVEYGSATITSTGSKTFVLADDTLQVEKVVLFVTDSSTVGSAGFGDQTINFAGGSAYNDETNTKALQHYRNVSGTKTLIIEGTIPPTSFVNAGEFVLAVTTVAASIQVKFVVFGS